MTAPDVTALCGYASATDLPIFLYDVPSRTGSTLALGGDGCISVLSNVVPRECRRLFLACVSGEEIEARQIERRLRPLAKALFAESNPVPLKWVLASWAA
jgi:dihydrodipicolinate synthase/N-acetylneuraminate lyase